MNMLTLGAEREYFSIWRFEGIPLVFHDEDWDVLGYLEYRHLEKQF